MGASPVLLFAHGAGFCKEIWAPIIRRMQQSALLQHTVGVDFVNVDLPFHGSNRDNSVVAQVDEKGPHVTHPANNAIALATAALVQKAQQYGSAGRPVIGIGHSMGAAALWKAEISSPGMFKGLVLFEPIYGPPTPTGPNRPYNFMAEVTLKREWKWPSREAAISFFENWKSFLSWDRESLSCWMQGAIVPDETDDGAVVLACHPTVEAGSSTRMYHQEIFEGIASRHPNIFKMHAPMVGKSHLMVLEDPEGSTLLFAHATGFCKQVWDPVIRRLKLSPLLQDAVDQYVTYDQPYHGVNRDNSVLGQVYYKNDDPSAPRVSHPMNKWPEISADAAWAQVQKLQSTGTESRPLIGIGHSMGAAALWATEAKHPGTFDGLILFEPIYGEVDAEFDKKADFLVSLTLAREKKWPSMEAAIAHFENWNNFSTWDREMLASWIEGAVVFDEEQQAAVLSCDPVIEASVYAGSRLVLTESELAAPRCPVTFHSGDRTKLFDRSVFDSFVAVHPNIYTNHAPLPKTSHLMVFEDPESATNAILSDLNDLSPFQTGFQPLESHL
ncbi:hypothetical protein JG688_00010408 [Phytophthora aleatoria]|uniref:AB hydrolase-1 domain-containing protein n=1 Tax=Phytophthora aleatoria TaxID=2496075 RepID=A0A8J5IEI1_9STRA|nr:hypothetical protein JG688_00010408 [Phytophthora aleatoria]